VRLNSAQAHALRLLRGATLRQTPHGWLVEGEHEGALLPPVVVRWLFGEGLLSQAEEPLTFTLSPRGQRAAAAAQAQTATAEVPTVAGPVLIIPPGGRSEELDYLLVVPVSSSWRAVHERRLEHADELGTAALGEFEFIQFRDELYALQISPRVAQLGLLPELEQFRILPAGIDAELSRNSLALRECPDRGVNYGRGWLQWFGGFDEESPLITSPRVDAAALTAQLQRLR